MRSISVTFEMLGVDDAERLLKLLRTRPQHAILLLGGNMGSITVKDSDAPFGATVTFLDAKGAQTSPDDIPAWASDNETAATVVASEDGLSATVTAGTPGAAIVSVTTTDNDGTVVTSQGTVTVLPGEAVIGDVEFSPPA